MGWYGSAWYSSPYLDSLNGGLLLSLVVYRRNRIEHSWVLYYHTAISSKLATAFRKANYVPYSLLTQTARSEKAQKGEEEMTFSVKGKLVAIGLDRSGERDLTFDQWSHAADVAERELQKYHPDRARRLGLHHATVRRLNARPGGGGWPVALAYDLRVREKAHADKKHDVSRFDAEEHALIVADFANMKASSSLPVIPSAFTRTFADAPPAKRPRLSSGASGDLCFRCGNRGHLPKDCSASTTIAGLPCAAISSSAHSANALAAPNGTFYCFSFASGRCMRGANCPGFHGCSLCGAGNHGARSCRRRTRS